MHDENGQEIDESARRLLCLVGCIHQLCHANGGGRRALSLSPSHYVYINIAKEMKLGRTSGWVVVAERVDRVCADAWRPHLLIRANGTS